MKADKIFYASWGFAIIMAGICAIIGLYFQWDLLSIVMLWFITVGVILIAVGLISLSSDRKTAVMQIIAGEILTLVTLGILAIYLHILDVYITLAVIIIIIGISVIAVGISRKG